MSKTVLGLLFILAGILYGSLSIDTIYNTTLGYLVEHEWLIIPPSKKELGKTVLGRKPTILLISAILIIIGIYLIWNRKI